ncbi:MAG TPA: hypothetical protein VD963_03535 [Phycisphaerales bacterium]|nr:hypothetical protein [Phycisphaerales bacterium]
MSHSPAIPAAQQPPARGVPWALWASAFFIAAAILVQLGRVGPLGAEARADVANQLAGFTLLTFEGGHGDVVLVMDSRAEDVLVYTVENQDRLTFMGRESLKDLFAQARGGGGAAGGGTRR